MSKKLSRLIYLGVVATQGISPPASGDTNPFAKVKRVLNVTDADATTEIDDSDYDDGADDSYQPGTRNARSNFVVNYDPNDPVHLLLEQMKDNSIVGSFLFRVENAAGADEWARDGFVVQFDHVSGGRQTVQQKTLAIRFSGAKRRAQVAVVA